jgi:hypothetical protein
VPALGRSVGSKPVMVALASWPMGRSNTSNLRLNGVEVWRNDA